MPGGSVSPIANVAAAQAGPSTVQSPWDAVKGFLSGTANDINNAGAWLQSRPMLLTGMDSQTAMDTQKGINQRGADAIAAPFNAISRVGATTMDFQNPATPGYLNLGASWRDSANVSPGQAIAGSQWGGSALYSAVTGKSIYGVPTTSAGGAIDVTNQAIRQQAFSDNLLGKVTSGAGDAIIDYYAAPDVIAGQIAKPIIASARGTKTVTAAEQTAAAEAAQKIAAGTPLSSNFDRGFNDLWMNRQNPGFVRNYFTEKGMPNMGLVSSVLSQSRDVNEFTTAFMAMRGDRVAMANLTAQAPAVAAQLQRADHSLEGLNNTISRWPIAKVNEDGSYTADFIQAKAVRDDLKAQVEDLKSRDQWLQQATGAPGIDGRNTTRSIANLLRHQTIGNSAGVNAQRARNAAWEAQVWGSRAPGYYVDSVFKPLGQGSMAVRVRNWMGSETPAGYVTLQGAGSVNSDREILAHLISADADAPTREYWTTKWNQAYTADQRQAIAVEMDNDLLAKKLQTHFDAKGIDNAKDQAKVKETAGRLMDEYRAQRGTALQQAKEDGGYIFDEATNSALHMKQLESEQSQLMPLTDFRAWEMALRRADPGAMQTLLTARNMAGQTLDTFGQIWKAGVLLRVGAIPKNLGESWLASYIYLGKTAGNPFAGVAAGAGKVTEGTFNTVGRIATNTAKRVDKAWQRAQGKEYDPRFTTLDDNLDVLHGSVQAREQDLRLARDTMANLVAQSRAEGGEAYYQQTDRLGTPLTIDEVMQSATRADRPTLRHSKQAAYVDLHNENHFTGPLTGSKAADLRSLHAQAARTHLRQKQVDGNEIMARRDGQWTPIDNPSALSDAELLPPRGSYAQAEPEVYVLPKYKQVIKGAPSPKKVAYSGITGDDASVWGERADQMVDLHNTMTDIEQGINGVRDDIDKVQQMIAGRTRKRGKAALTDITVGNQSAPAADAGVMNEIMRKNISADTKNLLTAHAMDVQGHVEKDWMRRVQETGLTKAYTIDDGADFFKAGAHYANTRVRNSPLGLRLLSGADPADVTRELLLPQNKGTLTALAEKGADVMAPHEVHSTVMGLQHNLFAAFPDERLRAKIVEGEITPQDVHTYLSGKDPETLGTIFDDQTLPVHLTSPKQVVDHIIDRGFHAFWSLPEDNLARWPLYRSVYMQEVKDGLAKHAAFLDGMPKAQADNWINNNIVMAAREQAQATVKKVVYSADRRSTPADALRFFSPFYQVTANRFAYYGGQMLENPQNMARMFNTWNSIGTSTDQYGNQVVTLHLPGFVAKMLGIEDTPDLAVNKSYLNLISSGDPWYSPGSGPIVQIPLAKFMRDNPDNSIQHWLKPIVGSKGLGIFQGDNYGKSDFDEFLPTTLRRVQASKDQQYWNTYTQIATVEAQKYQSGIRPTMPTKQEITDRANALWMFRLGAAEFLPVQPTVSNAGMDNIIKTYRQYQKQYGTKADTMFLADHPEMYDFAVNISKNNTGEAATDSAVGRQKANQGLIDSLTDPSMAGLVTNVPSDTGQFDSDAYNWQYGREVSAGGPNIRGAQSPTDVADQKILQRGWIEYAAATKQRDALLAAQGTQGGSTSISAKSNTWIAVAFKNAVDKIVVDTSYKAADGTAVSPWQQAFRSQNTGIYAQRAEDLARIVNSPGYVDANKGVQTWLPAAVQYLAERQKITDLLAQQQAAGGSGKISAKSNLWISLAWDATVRSLNMQNPAWADIQAQKFAHDDFQVVGE